MTSHLPSWSLNYEVAAIGAYATILVESVYLILGGFEDTSLLSISILTNSSAVLVAGFGGASSTAYGIFRISLTSLFLLWATVFQENETFDGTYPTLCSVAHLVYQLRIRRHGLDSERPLPRYERRSETDKVQSDSYLPTSPTDCNDAATFSRSLRIYFGESFCLEGAIMLVAILGTVMTYRALDFDLGFGLVFAFMSAFLSSVILLFVNYARTRGRRMDTEKALQQLVGLMFATGTFCFVVFTNVQFPDIQFSWWKISFGVSWCVY